MSEEKHLPSPSGLPLLRWRKQGSHLRMPCGFVTSSSWKSISIPVFLITLSQVQWACAHLPVQANLQSSARAPQVRLQLGRQRAVQVQALWPHLPHSLQTVGSTQSL